MHFITEWTRSIDDVSTDNCRIFIRPKNIVRVNQDLCYIFLLKELFWSHERAKETNKQDWNG